MNYFIHYKYFFFFSFICVISAGIYALVNFLISTEDSLLSEEPYSKEFPHALNMFNFQKIVCWRELPNNVKQDIFTPVTVLKKDRNKDEKQVCCDISEPSPVDAVCPVSLDGWSGINENMVFVFSAVNSNRTFIGSVGDSFDNPAFTIMSFDLKTIRDEWHLYSVPVVTILDKERDRLVTLAPMLDNQKLHALN